MPSYFGRITTSKILNKTLKSGADTFTGTGFLAMFSTNPTADGTGTEIQGGGYARQPITVGATTTGETLNTNLISFVNMPAVTLPYWAIYSAVTGGELLYYGSLETPYVLVSGDELKIAIGSLKIAFELGA